jgi:hypothetical protein
VTDRTCAECLGSLEGKRPQAKWCGSVCRDRARRARNRDHDRQGARRRYAEQRQAEGFAPRTIVETSISWDFPEGLTDEARKAASTMRRRYKVIDWDDLYQECLIWAATHPATIAAHLADPAKGLAYTGWAMRSRLQKLIAKELEHRENCRLDGLFPGEHIT